MGFVLKEKEKGSKDKKINSLKKKRVGGREAGQVREREG